MEKLNKTFVMNILTSLVVIPALTILVLIFTKTYKQARLVSAVGTGIEFLASLLLVWMYFNERGLGNTEEFFILTGCFMV